MEEELARTLFWTRCVRGYGPFYRRTAWWRNVTLEYPGCRERQVKVTIYCSV